MQGPWDRYRAQPASPTVAPPAQGPMTVGTPRPRLPAAQTRNRPAVTISATNGLSEILRLANPRRMPPLAALKKLSFAASKSATRPPKQR